MRDPNMTDEELAEEFVDFSDDDLISMYWFSDMIHDDKVIEFLDKEISKRGIDLHQGEKQC